MIKVKRDEDFLCHHGVKGQKWGERRFQNEDGSLTPAGKERYNKGDAKGTEKKPKMATKEDRKASDAAKTAAYEKLKANNTAQNKAAYTKASAVDRLNRMEKYAPGGVGLRNKLGKELIGARERSRSEKKLGISKDDNFNAVKTEAYRRYGKEYCDKAMKEATLVRNAYRAAGAAYIAGLWM